MEEGYNSSSKGAGSERPYIRTCAPLTFKRGSVSTSPSFFLLMLRSAVLPGSHLMLRFRIHLRRWSRHLPSQTTPRHAAPPYQARTRLSASPRRVGRSTPVAPSRHSTRADTAGTARRLPRPGRSRPSSPRASAIGAASRCGGSTDLLASWPPSPA